MFSLTCSSAGETETFGARLGQMLVPGDFLALFGELGAGKTQFTRGLALGLGVPVTVPVTSPTYTIMHEYSGRIKLYHFDFYRLLAVDDILELGFDEFFYGRAGVCVVEWAERLGDQMPDERLELHFHNQGDTVRAIHAIPHGERYLEICRNLFSVDR